MDDEKEAFDIVLMVHPNAVPYLPVECKRIAEDFTANHVGKGACLYHPYMGISYRDPTFDMYMNSQECLVGPGTEFLGGYKVLLRFMSLISALPYRGQTWPTWPLMACYFSVIVLIINMDRADMDTFPTPGLLGFWPEGVLLNNQYRTNFNLRRFSSNCRQQQFSFIYFFSIKYALKKIACEVR